MKQREVNDEGDLISSKLLKFAEWDSLTASDALLEERKEGEDEFNEFKSAIQHLIGVIFLMLSGLLMFIFGVVVLLSYLDYEHILKQRFFVVPYLAIFTGLFILITSIFGLYGAVSKRHYFITVYTVMIVMILALELSNLIVIFDLNMNTVAEITDPMMETLRLYLGSHNLEIKQIWDVMQAKFTCCGVIDHQDFIENEVPMSCCYVPYGKTLSFQCGITDVYPTGCANALAEWLSTKANLLSITTFAMFCLHALIAVTVRRSTCKLKPEETTMT